MNETKRNETVRFFADRMENCRSIAQQLRSDDREDEAVFAKIQRNVYDIFSTIFSVAVKTAGQDDEKVVQFFLTRIQQIPQSWHTALANAEKHGETENAHIEQIKLDAVAEIQNEFERIWEVAACVKPKQ